jgi:lipopolysaccharide export system protein LptA
MLTDTLQDMIVLGHYAQYDRLAHYAFVTDSTVAIMIDRTDSLYLHADTLKIITDSADQAKKMYAYFKVKFFREDLQGMCDSMTYTIADSTLTLYKEPVLWSDENQLSSDSIKIVYANKEIDSLVLHDNCFIASRDDTATFNQIKGKSMVGYFSNNELYKITVSGNSQTIYFVREDNGSLIGINKVVSSKMLIFIKENQIKTITYIDMPKATLYPEKDIPPMERKLKGFKWIEGRRPLSKHDIFVW